jgi:hypothetical protein
MRPPRLRIRTMMVGVAVIGIGMALACRPYPINTGSPAGGWLRTWLLWSDRSITEYPNHDRIDRELTDRSKRPPHPIRIKCHLGRCFISLHRSDGSRGWYFTPFEPFVYQAWPD